MLTNRETKNPEFLKLFSGRVDCIIALNAHNPRLREFGAAKTWGKVAIDTADKEKLSPGPFLSLSFDLSYIR